MIILRNKLFSNDKYKFETQKQDIYDDYKKGISHGINAVSSSALAGYLAKHAIRNKGRKILGPKVLGTAALASAANAGYSGYRSVKNIKRGLNKAKNPAYQKYLDEEIEGENKKWDKEYNKVQRDREDLEIMKQKIKDKEKDINKRRKDLGLYIGHGHGYLDN